MSQANWAYFSFGPSYPLADSSQAFPAAACNACHEASAADDFVFTQYYPVLRAAKGTRSGRSMNSSSKEFQKMENVMSGTMNPAFEAAAKTAKIDSVVPVTKDLLFSYQHRFDVSAGCE